MLFNSTEFFIFFPVVTILFFLLPNKGRWALLLAASCYFYMAFIPYYILILGFTIVVDYIAGIYIEDAADKKKRKFFLICSLVANVGVLAVFKYYNFFNDNLTELLRSLGMENPVPFLQIALPVGLSFHTFQALSYTIEVYRGNFKAERHFGIYALYVMFYPQLVAGPIERPQNVLHQFYTKHRFDYYRIASGLKLMLWGFFKKLVIADRLSVYVNTAYNNPGEADGFSLLITTYLFAFQIYCDFSGYSDIALGAARVMGFELMENFRVPYIAKSIKEFWSRWHISLSTWFRDYLYIPMGGNKVPEWRWYYNLFIVFLISGFWHGANWTYIVWGALHGLYLVSAIIIDKILSRTKVSPAVLKSPFFNITRTLFTFHLVVLAWIFFRAASVSDAMLILNKIAVGAPAAQFPAFTSSGDFLFSIALLILFIFIDPLMDKLVKGRVTLPHKVLSYMLYGALLAAIVLFGYFGEVQFIYFQF